MPSVFRFVLITPIAIVIAGGGKAVAGSCLHGFSLFSQQQTIVRDRGHIASGSIGSNGYVEIGIDAKSKDLSAGGSSGIRLRDRATGFGNAKSAGPVILHAGAQVIGTTWQNVSVPTCDIPQQQVTPGSQAINVGAGNTMDLPPGAYGEVRVSANGRLKLSPGTYSLNLLLTEADGKLELDAREGAVRIKVASSLSFGDRTGFIFTGGQIRPERVKIYSGQTSQVAIGTDINPLAATLMAPKAQIRIASRTVLRGAAIGKSLDLQPDVVVHYVAFQGGALPPVYPPTYIPGETPYLQACQQALQAPPPPGNPAWVQACSTAVRQDVFKRRVAEQLPGRNLGPNPPKVASSELTELSPPVSGNNARMEVTFAEYLPDTMHFVWNRQVKTLRDDGMDGDVMAHDGVYGVFLQVDPAAFAEPPPGQALDGSVPLLAQCGNPDDPQCHLHPEKAFMIRDLRVVNNEDRTADPCLDANPADAQKKWTFGYLLSQMVSPEEIENAREQGIPENQLYSNFATQWLNRWHQPTQLVNGQGITTQFQELFGGGITTLPLRLYNKWRDASAAAGAQNDRLLMHLAPFRLSAIVNRLDLRDNVMWTGGPRAGGELRFVFSILNLETRMGGGAEGPCGLMSLAGLEDGETGEPDHTLILEYAVDQEVGNVYTWAEKWVELSQLDFESSQYLEMLDGITESVVTRGRGAAFTRPNGSALSQLRANETADHGDWDLREFVIASGTSGFLVPETVKKTPANSLKNSDILGKWLVDNKQAYNDVLIGREIPEIPSLVPPDYPNHPEGGTWMLGAQTLNRTSQAGFWRPNPQGNWLDYSHPGDRQARHIFSLNTCSACHSAETRDPNNPFPSGNRIFFAHVMPRKYNEISLLSNFLTGFSADPSDPPTPVYVPDPVVTAIPDISTFQSMAWTGTRYVGVGGNRIATSSDSYNFSVRDVNDITGPGTLPLLNGLAWTGSGLVAVGFDQSANLTGLILTSPDGASWTQRTSGTSSVLNGVTYSEDLDLRVAVGENGTLLTSPDGMIWTPQSTGTTQNLLAIQALAPGSGGTPLSAVGSGGVILNSQDGINWVPAASGTTGALRAIYGQKWTGSAILRVAVGDEGRILTSFDGEAWTPRVSGTDKNLLAVTWAENIWVAVGEDGTVRVSADAMTWEPRASRVRKEADLRSVLWTGNALAVAGTLHAGSERGLFMTDPAPTDPEWVLGATGDRFRYFEDLRLRWQDLFSMFSGTLEALPLAPSALIQYRPSGRAH